MVLDDFEIEGPHGSHQCLLFKPLGMNYATLLWLKKARGVNGLDKIIVKSCLRKVLEGLNFMHQAGVVHTGVFPCFAPLLTCQLRNPPDLSPGNLHFTIPEKSFNKAVPDIERAEIEHPTPRKILSDRVIHTGWAMPATSIEPVICDFGHARLGEPEQKYSGDVMPGSYRAPEVILDMEWDHRIDIWSVGLTVRTAPFHCPCICSDTQS